MIISRFDWWDGQPDNYEHHEMCLTLWEQHDPFFPIVWIDDDDGDDGDDGNDEDNQGAYQ